MLLHEASHGLYCTWSATFIQLALNNFLQLSCFVQGHAVQLWVALIKPMQQS